MSECTICGATPEKNSAGHYREKCMSCLRESTRGRERHGTQCTVDECMICNDWLREWQERVRPLYLKIKLWEVQAPENNQTLSQY